MEDLDGIKKVSGHKGTKKAGNNLGKNYNKFLKLKVYFWIKNPNLIDVLIIYNFEFFLSLK